MLPSIRRTGSYAAPGFEFDAGQEREDLRLYLSLVDECRRTLRDEMRQAGLYVAAPAWPYAFAVAPQNDALDRVFAMT